MNVNSHKSLESIREKATELRTKYGTTTSGETPEGLARFYELAGFIDGVSGCQRSTSDISVDELELSVRAANVLENCDIKTIKDLQNTSVYGIRRKRLAGKKVLEEISFALARNGYGILRESDLCQ